MHTERPGTFRVLARRLAAEHRFDEINGAPGPTMAPSTLSKCVSTPASPVANDFHVDDGEH